VVFAALVIDHGWSWWVAFPVVVALGVVTGVGVEWLVIRPMRHRGRRGVTMLLVTIGVGQLLLALTFVPAVAPDPGKVFHEQYPLPFHVHWRPLRADLTGADVMILLVVPIAVSALAAFLRWAPYGKAIRAA